MKAIDFAAVFARSPNPCLLVDRELRYVAANDAYVRVTGTRLEALIGRFVFELFPNDPADPDHDRWRLVRESIERAIRSGETDVLAVPPYRVPDGVAATGRCWRASHTPILDAGGQVAFVLQHTTDVTADANPALGEETRVLRRQLDEYARLEAERVALLERERVTRADLEASEAAQRFLAESIPQQVWTAAPSGELTFVNRRVLQYFNATQEQVLGAGWQSVVHQDDLVGCLASWRHALDTGEEYEVEFRLRRFDGEYRWHLARAVPQIDADGAILQWFGTNTDMDELTRARDELRERVAFERQVIGIVSHDLRGPLDAIGVGSALMLKRGGLDEAQQKVMRRLSASATRAGRMVRDFLDFTQARVSGRLPVAPVEINLAEIARQVFEEVQLTYPARTGVVEHVGEETAHLDPDRIAQMLGNLVGNAFQHSTGEGVVRLTTTGTVEEIVIEVANEGLPIPPADLLRLFEPFERGGGAKTSTGRSLGLGLYIAKQIVTGHGGTIIVRSEAGATVFSVRLPRSM